MCSGAARLLLRGAASACASRCAPAAQRARLQLLAASRAGRVPRRAVMAAVAPPAMPPLDTAAAALDGPPLFRVGVLTDVQYADIPDGHSFGGTPRFYRHSLEALREAVADWRTRDGMSVALHLGDILDGFCPKEESEAALRRVLDAFDALGRPVRHCLGNHCLYNLPRATLNARLGIQAPPCGGSFYSFSPHAGFRVVMLDSYDVSLLGWPAGHPRHEAAAALLAAHNPNANKNSPEGLEGSLRRFVAFGGGVGEEQLAWLEATLAAADAAGEKVFVAGHLPLHPDTAAAVCLLWNYEAVLAVLGAHRCVVATLAGHTHREGYARDARGVHHRVLAAVLECPPGTNAFGHLDVWPHCARLVGTDRMSSTEMQFGGVAVEEEAAVLAGLAGLAVADERGDGA